MLHVEDAGEERTESPQPEAYAQPAECQGRGWPQRSLWRTARLRLGTELKTEAVRTSARALGRAREKTWRWGGKPCLGEGGDLEAAETGVLPGL